MSLAQERVGLAIIVDRDQLTDPYNDQDLITNLVKESLWQGGLGQQNPDILLADIIQPGMTVVLKPNWVLHYNQSGETMDCMVTHPNFIIAVLQEVLKTQPKKVIIGDAPIQACLFDSLVTTDWKAQVQKIVEQTKTTVEIIDFRRTIVQNVEIKDGFVENARDSKNYVLFDLKEDSLLETISSSEGKFRITNYHPDKLKETHHLGKHQYLLCKEAFDADVIINLPKLKTHRKAGITAALKNLVGINGNKEFLPHHRIGGASSGGDCYPGFAPLKRIAEFFLDNANRHIGTEKYLQWHTPFSKLIRLHAKLGGDPELEGGWYGNDTVWRMVLDLNRLLLYGCSDGTLSTNLQRNIYSLTDGIIAGENEGPLAPTPVKLGIVTFASSSAYADLVHSTLMNFDWQKIPLVQNSFEKYKYSLTELMPENCQVYFQNNSFSLEEIKNKFSYPFQSARGWKNYIEYTNGGVYQ